MKVRLRLAAIAVSLVWGAGTQLASLTNTAADVGGGLGRINHIVVIYQENHSFDNLYGLWEGVNGLGAADPAHTIQVGQGGVPYACLLQNDVNLGSPPQPADCVDTTTATTFSSHFTNAPFQIDAFIPSSALTCPQPGVFAPKGLLPSPSNLSGGCTRDMAHRFYQEQYQFDGGKQDLYTTGSDAVGLTQGYFDTRALPVYEYLHQDQHQSYAIADDFFQAAFGGSFLNHQWLIAANTPVYPAAPAALHSIIDSNGMPVNLPLYHATGPVSDRALTVACPSPVPGRACGDYAVNTIQSTFQPHGGGAQLPPLTGKTIGDELTEAGVSWAWYSGGWSNADGDVDGPGWTNGAGPACADPDSFANPAFPFCPNKTFQFHHQAFNYYAAYAPGTPGRAHLQDEEAFISLADNSSDSCRLNAVSFIKPVGLDNEHPGYASVTRGQQHVVELLQAIDSSACRNDTMVLVTYDEFGGGWDHVPPPGQASQPGPHDQWGPGTRIPALIIAPNLLGSFVIDHAQHDTTSVLATIEHRFGLAALGTRDAAVQDLSSVFAASRFQG